MMHSSGTACTGGGQSASDICLIIGLVRPGSFGRIVVVRCIVPVSSRKERHRMIDRAFLKAGHPPTLLAAFLYFDAAFMVWVMLGPLGVQAANDLGLDAAKKGLMVATPLLAGAILRV